MMQRWLVLGALLAGLAALPASAQTATDLDLSEVATGLRAEGFWVEEGMRIDEAAVGAVLDDARQVLYLIVLADDRGTDPAFIAEEVAGRFASGTFVARTDQFIGIYSLDFGQADVDRAIAAYDLPDDVGLAAIDVALSGTSPAGGGGFPIGTVILVLAGGGVIYMVLTSNQRSARATERRVSEAREQLTSLAGEVADDIVSLNDLVAAFDDPTVTEHYREANRIFAAAEEGIASATHERELVDLSTQLTEAEWRLEAVEAIVDGREPPQKPADRPIECFFHSTKAGVEEATIETPAGSRTVSVCRECAERLRKGEAPVDRLVQVGGRQVPVGMAPRSHGGGGLDAMDVFAIMMAGGAVRRTHRWGSTTPGLPARTRSRSSTPRHPSPRSGGGRASRRL
jgi:hypothetical protein